MLRPAVDARPTPPRARSVEATHHARPTVMAVRQDPLQQTPALPVVTPGSPRDALSARDATVPCASGPYRCTA